MMDNLLDIQQAAEILGCHKRTVYREIERERLRCVKVGGMTRFRPSDLERYLRSRERGKVA